MWRPEYIFRVCFIISEFLWSNKDYAITAMLENNVTGKQKKNIKKCIGFERGKMSKQMKGGSTAVSCS
jgi:hypothetical protein